MGHFVNPQGYSLVKVRDVPYFWVFSKAIYECRLKPGNAALTYTDDIGRSYRSDRHYYTDMGSVPKLAQVFVPKDRFLKSFLMHDSAYKNGGLWVYWAPLQIWRFEHMVRDQVDELLAEMCEAEGAPGLEADAIWTVVRAGGAFSGYGKGDAEWRNAA